MADQRTRRVMSLLLILHIVLFMTFLLSAARFANLQLYNPFPGTNPLAVALVWVPVLLAHVAAHAYFAGKVAGGGDGRAAYRQGFRDAVHDLAASGQLADSELERYEERAGYGERLLIDDMESGVFESGEKPKRQAIR